MNKKPIYLFGTCLIDNYFPEWGEHAADLLEWCGWQVIFPQHQTCCGQPPYNAGFPQHSTPVAKQTIQLFSEPPHPLIVPSASCAAMIKEHYPKLMSNDKVWRDRALELANRTHDLLAFLSEALPYEALSGKPVIRVALHQSCSAQRETRTADHWHDILNRMPNVEVVLPENASDCCGFGGTFSVTSPEISEVMTRDKCRSLIDTQADVFVSGDAGCLLSMNSLASKQSLPFKGIHLASFLNEQFRHAHESV